MHDPIRFASNLVGRFVNLLTAFGCMVALGIGLKLKVEVENYKEICSLEDELMVHEEGEEKTRAVVRCRRQRDGGGDGGGGGGEHSLSSVFLTKLLDATESRSEISYLLPFFAFNTLSALVAATTKCPLICTPQIISRFCCD